jgi:predicted Zn-dependent peptidase
MVKEMVFEKTTLPSGIRVVSETIPHVRSVAIGFWVGVGSRDEDVKNSGMSHFVEHLMFKGTKSRTAQEISEIFDTLGAELNAFTAKEYTCYYARLLDEHVPVGLDVLSDMLQNPKFDSKDVEAERKVVLEEINLHEDSPDERIHDLFAETLLNNHPLGQPVLGTATTVADFKRGDITHFFTHEYVPSNIVLAAAGNYSHQKLVELVEKYFQGKSGLKPSRKESQPRLSKRINVLTKKTEQAHICYGAKALYAGHKDRFILSILDNILGGGMSSRLFQEIRERRGLAYAVYSYHSLYSETGLLAVYAGTSPSNVSEVVKLIKEEILKIVEEGVTKQELHRAKEHIKGQLVLSLESTGRRMTRLGKVEMTHGELLTLDEIVARISAVTLSDVKRLAEDIFDPKQMVLTLIGPLDEEKLTNLIN